MFLGPGSRYDDLLTSSGGGCRRAVMSWSYRRQRSTLAAAVLPNMETNVGYETPCGSDNDAQKYCRLKSSKTVAFVAKFLSKTVRQC